MGQSPSNKLMSEIYSDTVVSANNLVPLIEVESVVALPEGMSRIDLLAPILGLTNPLDDFVLDLHYSIDKTSSDRLLR